MSRPRCSYERPCGQGEVGRSGSPSSTWGGWATWPQPQDQEVVEVRFPNMTSQLGKLTSHWQESKRSFPFEGPCASNDHSQCQAPGNEAGSSGGMLCDVECTNRCPDFLTTFHVHITSVLWIPLLGRGFKLRGFQTTPRVKATQVTGSWLDKSNFPRVAGAAGGAAQTTVLVRTVNGDARWLLISISDSNTLIFWIRGTGSARLAWSVSCTMGKSSGSASTLTSARWTSLNVFSLQFSSNSGPTVHRCLSCILWPEHHLHQ